MNSLNFPNKYKILNSYIKGARIITLRHWQDQTYVVSYSNLESSTDYYTGYYGSKENCEIEFARRISL